MQLRLGLPLQFNSLPTNGNCRAAVGMRIAKGGATFFSVFAGTFKTVHEPLSKPLEFEWNGDQRKARFRVAGIVEATSGPIKNPVTGSRTVRR